MSLSFGCVCFCFQQRSWPRFHLKALTVRRGPCLTSPRVSRLRSACRPPLPAPPLLTASATRRVTPPLVPRVRSRWQPPRLCPLHPRWPGRSPRPDRPPNRPGRGPACLPLSLPPHLAPALSPWSTHRGSWTVCLLGKACPQVTELVYLMIL